MIRSQGVGKVFRKGFLHCFCILSFLLFLFDPCSLFAVGAKDALSLVKKKDSKAPPTLQERYDALPETIPAICVIPASATSAVPAEIVAAVDEEICKQMIIRKLSRPVSMNKWLATTYGKRKAESPFALLRAIDDEQYAVQLKGLSRAYLFKSGDLYGVQLDFYSLGGNSYPIQVLRLFSEIRDIPDVISSALDEYTARGAARDDDGKKRVIINGFKIEFRKLVELESGEFEFVSAPFIEREGVNLKDGDDFFSAMLGYELATSGMIQTIRLADFAEYSDSDISMSQNADFAIRGRVQLTDQMNVLYVDLYDAKTGTKIASLRSPMKELSLKSAWDAYRTMSVSLIKKMLPQDTWGVASGIVAPKRGFFANGMFVAWESLDNFVLPRGINSVSTGSLKRPIDAIIAMQKANPKGAEKKPEGKEPWRYEVLLDGECRIFADREGEYVRNLLSK